MSDPPNATRTHTPGAAARAPSADSDSSGVVDRFVGSILSHYQLEEAVGQGGIGVVYRAKDITLGRSVAVKVLSRGFATSDDARARFLREARAASALDHPNIATILEFGEQDGVQFIAMHLYEGETLKEKLEAGPLGVAEAAQIVGQIATGLDAAHRADIIHRDIKSANIFLTRNQTVKLLDFGLAKLISGSAAQSVTKAGEALGTLLYMSPEQLRGDPVDQRSDLWSMGVVAYEMVAGANPFQTDSNAATAVRILNEDPPSLSAVPGVPAWYAELVARLLKKNPDDRLQSAAEVLDHLHRAGVSTVSPGSSGSGSGKVRGVSNISRGLPAAPARRWWALLACALVVAGGSAFLYARLKIRPGIRSLVVLPFKNVTANLEVEYLSEGIAEDLINSLSEIPELQVIARTTAFQYKGKELDIQRFGRELAVDAVLTGRVQQLGDTLVVQADLVNVRTGSELWGHRYNRKLTDVLGVQREITRDISDQLRPRLTADVQRRIAKRFSEDPEAYQLYLRGRYFWNKRSEPSLVKAVTYFKQAIQADPNFAAAHSGLADAHIIRGAYGYAPMDESLAIAEPAARKAIALDGELAEAHASLGIIKFNQWDWAATEREYQQAIALNPNYATAHQWYAVYLAAAGRREQAFQELKKAQQLDPGSLVINVSVGTALCATGEIERGIASLKETAELEPGSGSAHLAMAECYVRTKRYHDALDEIEKARAIDPGSDDCVSGTGYIYAITGRRADARAILEELKKKDATKDRSGQIAAIYAGLDDRDHLFEWLEKAYQRRANWLLIDLRHSIIYDPFRADPRFADLLRRIGSPP